MAFLYNVRFLPGRYKVLPPGPVKAWQIGREDDGTIAGFAFEENEAKHICLALNLVDAYISGDTSAQREMLQALGKLRN